MKSIICFAAIVGAGALLAGCQTYRAVPDCGVNCATVVVSEKRCCCNSSSKKCVRAVCSVCAPERYYGPYGYYYGPYGYYYNGWLY